MVMCKSEVVTMTIRMKTLFLLCSLLMASAAAFAPTPFGVHRQSQSR